MMKWWWQWRWNYGEIVMMEAKWWNRNNGDEMIKWGDGGEMMKWKWWWWWRRNEGKKWCEMEAKKWWSEDEKWQNGGKMEAKWCKMKAKWNGNDGDDRGEMMKCEMMIKIMNIEADGEYEGGMEAKSGVKWRRKNGEVETKSGKMEAKWCKMEAKNGEVEAEWRRKGGKLSKWGKKKWNIKFL